MRYQAGQRRKAIEYEKALAEWWKKNKTFEQSVENRPIDKSYVFYDGPPFITGNPHHGTLLSSIVKDAVPRFWTMNGFRCERRWGWDCHGLPAENFVEKQLGITDRREIGTKWSLEDYIIKARESMVANSETWRSTIDRIGRWVDFDNCYRTMNKDFMESVWWAFKKLYEAGKIYEGRKVLMYDTKFATPVSKAEVTMDNDAYQTVTDPSVYVKFKAIPKAKSYLMGTADITSRLQNLKIVFTKEDDVFLVQLSPDQFEDYEKLVEETLEPTYWNEYIYNGEVRFTFKDKNGEIHKYIWHRGDEEDNILKLCQEYAETKFDNIEKMITDNEFYRNVFDDLYFLAWTTTPWTLPANLALAVHPDVEYAKVRIGDDLYIIAKSCIERAFKGEDYEIVQDGIKGGELVGEKYEPLISTILEQNKKSETFTVLAGDFVTTDEGTGIVHEAPAYGEVDYELCITREVDFLDVLDENGYYIPEYAEKLHALGVRDTDEHGIQIWAANKFIAKCLEEKGIVYKIEYIQHEYPFNPRSKERIMYRAFPSWFFDIEGQKPLMLAENENINWFPEHLKHGRFAKNIEQAPDWNLSRDRFWATAMPVWKSEEGTVLVIGSYEELKDFSGKELADYHRPWVDEIEFDAWVKDGQVLRGRAATVASTASMGDTAGGTPAARRRQPSTVGEAAVAGPIDKQASSADTTHLEHFTRIEKVLDCWFESGSMPFAQLHYPFENKEKFERNYPADFIVEYVGQVRAWFYYVHAVNTALAEIGAFGETAKKGHKNAYKNVITTGTLAGNDGRKMSKSLGNFTDPNILMDQYSADALRFLLLSSPVLSGEDFALLDKDVSDVNRKLAMIWNVYDFFTTYAEIEDIDNEELEMLLRETVRDNGSGMSEEPRDDGRDEASRTKRILSSPLDSWIISRMYQLRNEITAGMEEYNIPRALENVLLFIDDLSNWFVRRSRRRFSKNDYLDDKKQAFATLYHVLIYTAKLLAPFTPFLAEELYQKMTGSTDSVHLLKWPAAGEIDEEVLAKMAHTRQIITDALALRMQKSDTEQQIKIRQPLSKLTYDGEKLPDFYEQIIADEVNVKSVVNGSELTLDKTLTEELKIEGYARDLIRAIQAARKHAGLQVDNQIKLSLSVDLPVGYEDLVKTEVNAVEVNREGNYAHDEIAKINGENITISLEKI